MVRHCYVRRCNGNVSNREVVFCKGVAEHSGEACGKAKAVKSISPKCVAKAGHGKAMLGMAWHGKAKAMRSKDWTIHGNKLDER